MKKTLIKFYFLLYHYEDSSKRDYKKDDFLIIKKFCIDLQKGKNAF